MSTTSPSIRRVAYTTKADAVYAELRRSILGAAIAPGSPLNQEQLAATLGVSTTPLREALRRLEAEGLVEVTAHRQLVVTTAEIADLPNLFLVKEELDCLAARLAARRATEDDRRLLQDALSPEPPDGDVRWAGWAANKELHLAIVRATHNPVLIEESSACWIATTATCRSSTRWSSSIRSPGRSTRRSWPPSSTGAATTRRR